MNRRNATFSTIIPAFCMITLIFDSKTAISGAKDGLLLCLQTVIPCLLPFFILSSLLTSSLSGMAIKILQPIRKLCKIPDGAESILLIGLIGGYPIGAQSIAQAWKADSLTKQDAHRLLGFCSNAGPSFIFGILGSVFSKGIAVWLLWAIHIFSAVCVGCVLPAVNKRSQCRMAPQRIDLVMAVNRSILSLGNVCGWIILMRVIISFFNRWFFWLVPDVLRAYLIGILELTNGCHVLTGIKSEATRFIISSGILGFGGICVGLQTISATHGLGTGMYFPGKLLQGTFSLLLSTILAALLYDQAITQLWQLLCCSIILAAATVAYICYRFRKKGSFFHKACV